MIYQSEWWVVDSNDKILFYKSIHDGRWEVYTGKLSSDSRDFIGCKAYKNSEEFIIEHFSDLL